MNTVYLKEFQPISKTQICDMLVAYALGWWLLRSLVKGFGRILKYHVLLLRLRSCSIWNIERGNANIAVWVTYSHIDWPIVYWATGKVYKIGRYLRNMPEYAMHRNKPTYQTHILKFIGVNECIYALQLIETHFLELFL